MIKSLSIKISTVYNLVYEIFRYLSAVPLTQFSLSIYGQSTVHIFIRLHSLYEIAIDLI